MVRLLPEDRGPHLTRAGLARAFRSRRAWLVAALAALVYAILYLLIARSLLIAPEAEFGRFRPVPSLVVAPDLSWRHLTDVFNPAFIAYLSDSVALALPLPIAAGALVIGALVGANVAVAIETLTFRATQCARASALGILSTLPSFLGSFACCAPTVLFALGANFAVALVAVVPFVVPAASALLLGSLLWSARRLEAIAEGGIAPLG